LAVRGLIIEAQVDPADIYQVYPRQKTTVRLSAFNMRTTPEMNGIVFQTSADRIIASSPEFDIATRYASWELYADRQPFCSKLYP